MSDPEIARRCLACGATIRDRALFCPQCGNAVGDETKKLDESADVYTQSLHQATQDLSAETHTQPLNRLSQDPTVEDRTIPEPVAATHPLITQPPSDHPMTQPSTRLQRAAAGAKEFEGDVIQRVDQIRRVSSVVIDQASHDPSLRFILVAASLFILFLTILIMSKLIG